MEEKKTVKVNPLPQITWHRLRMNDSTLPFALPEEPCAWEVSGLTDEMNWEEAADASAWNGMETGMGPEFNSVMEDTPLSVLTAAAGARSAQPVVISAQENACAAGRIGIRAESGSALSVIVALGTAGNAQDAPVRESDRTDSVQIKLDIKEDAQVRLYVVQTLSREGLCMIDIGGVCEDKGSLELVEVLLGGAKEYAGIAVDLKGEESRFTGDMAYRVMPDQKLDINYVTHHEGRESFSSLTAWGVLEQDSWKLFRGTLDFLEGCPGSNGAEKEEILLMGDRQVNQTIPLILCHEEDVEGAHGATISRLDEQMLFYLGSRGVDKETAENMIAQARLEAICSRIPHPEIRSQAEAMIGSVDEGVEKDEVL